METTKLNKLLLVLSCIVFAFVPLVGVIPFVLSLINRVSGNNDREYCKRKKWLILTLIIAYIVLFAIAAIFFKSNPDILKS